MKFINIILLVTILCLTCDTKFSKQVLAQGNHGEMLSPIVFVPGDGGSQLEAKLNKTYRIHYICDMVSDWYDIWLNLHLLTPVTLECLSDNLKLHYNSSTRTSHNTEGVQIRVAGFGNLEPVAYLDLAKLPFTDYFEKIIATLEKKRGYIRNENMVGAAYDFRKAPNELGDYFDQLASLIESTYVHNNYRPVTLICHSMGCLNSVYLLNRKSQNWKDVFIERLITLAAPWDGSFEAINAMLFGDNLGIPMLSRSVLQALQSTFPSLMYLFPRAPTFAEDRVLIETPEANISLKNFDQLFKAAGLPDQLDMWRDTIGIAANLTAPNVEIWCLYGGGFNTTSKLVFEDARIAPVKAKYKALMDDGDGTVNLESLQACENFQHHQDKRVLTRQFQGLDHIDILRKADAADWIADHIITGSGLSS